MAGLQHRSRGGRPAHNLRLADRGNHGELVTMIYSSILDTIGRTPIVRINRLAPPAVAMYAKVESFNPGGSVKDRLAIAIIEDAEQRGVLKPGQTVVEATSG